MAGKARTHCLKGHEFTESNTYLAPKDGKRNCKTCMYERHKRWAETNRERHNELHRNWSRSNPDKEKLYRNNWEGRKRYTRNRDLVNNYGLTIEDYEQMLTSQNNCCAICKLELKKPCVDHCHITGNIRQVLCGKCNTGLGMFQDDIELLEAAITYLRKHATIERVFDEQFA